MKKLFIVLCAVLLFASCALHSDYVTRSEVEQMIEQAKTGGTDMQVLLAMLKDTAKNRIRAFTSHTGQGVGALDAISTGNLENGDGALVFTISGSTVKLYPYVYDADGTDNTDTTNYTVIRPYDYSTGGNWRLVTSVISGQIMAPSSTPQWNFRDLEATAGDDNVRIYVNCTDVGDGTEDCDLTIAVQIAGTLTDVVEIDADGVVAITALPLLSKLNINPQSVSSYTIGTDNIEEVYGTYFVNNDNDPITFVHPAASGGEMGCIGQGDGVSGAITFDNTADYFIYEGEKMDAGEYLISNGSANDQICWVVIADSIIKITSTQGSWSQETP